MCPSTLEPSESSVTHNPMRGALNADDLGKNGKHVLETPFEKYFLTGAHLFLTEANGDLIEDPHFDGGAGVLHVGLTLTGRRNLKCWKENGISTSFLFFFDMRAVLLVICFVMLVKIWLRGGCCVIRSGALF
jgi:hypothetical protein